MIVKGSTIQQLDKGPDGKKPKSRCRKWRIWATTDEGRKSLRFEGTYSQALDAQKAFVTELEGIVPNAETFGAYARTWREYRAASGDLEPNTLANDLRNERALQRSPMWGRRMASITPETCRADLLWVKGHPQVSGKDELSGTTMAKIHLYVHQMLGQAADDGKIASNPMAKVKAPKLDTKEREALSWGELTLLLNRLDELPLSAYSMCVYAICCHALRRAEACALADEGVTASVVMVRQAVKESTGELGAPKSKAGVRDLPTVPRFYEKVCEWRALRESKGLADAPTLFCDVKGGVLRPQNLYRWWAGDATHKGIRDEIGCSGITLHQLRHSNITHVARHMSEFDLLRYAGWSSLAPARIYVHDNYAALAAGVSRAWDAPDAIERTKYAPDKNRSETNGL